jgi:hypothetical protein
METESNDMTADDHEMPPHLARYLASLGEPGKTAEPPDPVDGARIAVTPGSDIGQYLTAEGEPPGVWGGLAAAGLGLSGKVDPAIARSLFRDPDTVLPALAARADPAAPSAIQADGHVDPAAAARYRQAQTELVGLIRAENRARAADPQAASVLPDKLGAWMEQRAAELDQAEADQPGIEPPS